MYNISGLRALLQFDWHCLALPAKYNNLIISILDPVHRRLSAGHDLYQRPDALLKNGQLLLHAGLQDI